MDELQSAIEHVLSHAIRCNRHGDSPPCPWPAHRSPSRWQRKVAYRIGVMPHEFRLVAT